MGIFTCNTGSIIYYWFNLPAVLTLYIQKNKSACILIYGIRQNVRKTTVSNTIIIRNDDFEPHRHIRHIGEHIENYYVNFYVSMRLCGKKKFIIFLTLDVRLLYLILLIYFKWKY